MNNPLPHSSSTEMLPSMPPSSDWGRPVPPASGAGSVHNPRRVGPPKARRGAHTGPQRHNPPPLVTGRRSRPKGPWAWGRLRTRTAKAPPPRPSPQAAWARRPRAGRRGVLPPAHAHRRICTASCGRTHAIRPLEDWGAPLMDQTQAERREIWAIPQGAPAELC